MLLYRSLSDCIHPSFNLHGKCNPYHFSSLGQMAKNKLTIQNPKALLAEMYILVMGDEAEEIDDVSVVYF